MCIRDRPYVGGAVFYGGLLGGLAAGALYLRIRRLPFAAYADIAAPAIPDVYKRQALRRWRSPSCAMRRETPT